MLYYYFLYLKNHHLRKCLLILETGRETSIWERNIKLLPLVCSPTKDWTHNLGMCLVQESNLWSFSLENNAPANSVTPARAVLLFFNVNDQPALMLGTSICFNNIDTWLPQIQKGKWNSAERWMEKKGKNEQIIILDLWILCCTILIFAFIGLPYGWKIGFGISYCYN